MKTIEDKLQAAHELGRIVGAAGCFADEDVRNTVCGAARALFDGLLTEATEDLRTAATYWKRKYEDAIEFNKPHLGRPASDYPHRVIQKVARDYPPDVFDFVETGEMVERQEPEPMRPRTNLEWLCDNPEELAKRLDCPYDICPHTDASGAGLCVPCILGYLREEHKNETH